MPAKKRNGISMYIDLVMRPEYKERTGKCLPIHEFIKDALPIYQSFSAAEKNRFEQLAKEFNKKQKGTRLVLDNTASSKSMNFVDKDLLFDESQRASVAKAKQKLINAFSRMSIDDILNMKFYFIGAESMCLISDDSMPLVELGMIELNLIDGIVKEFHKSINPGPIPLGYRAASIQNSQSRHMIPVENFELGERMYSQLYQAVVDFMDGSDYMAFCAEDDMKHVFRGLDWLYEKARLVDAPAIVLGHVEDLVELLFQKVDLNISQTEIQNMYSVSFFDYWENSSCSLHDEVNAKYCALGSCKRICYIMMENVAKFYGINVSRGHMPSDLIAVASKQINDIQNSCYESDDDFNFPSRDIRYKEASKEPKSSNQYTNKPDSVPQHTFQDSDEKLSDFGFKDIDKSSDFGFKDIESISSRNMGRGAYMLEWNERFKSECSHISVPGNEGLSGNSNGSQGSQCFTESVKSCRPFTIAGRGSSIPSQSDVKLMPPSNFQPLNIHRYESNLLKSKLSDAFDSLSMVSSLDYSELQKMHGADAANLSDISDCEDF